MKSGSGTLISVATVGRRLVQLTLDESTSSPIPFLEYRYGGRRKIFITLAVGMHGTTSTVTVQPLGPDLLRQNLENPPKHLSFFLFQESYVLQKITSVDGDDTPGFSTILGGSTRTGTTDSLL